MNNRKYRQLCHVSATTDQLHHNLLKVLGYSDIRVYKEGTDRILKDYLNIRDPRQLSIPALEALLALKESELADLQGIVDQIRFILDKAREQRSIAPPTESPHKLFCEILSGLPQKTLSDFWDRIVNAEERKQSIEPIAADLMKLFTEEGKGEQAREIMSKQSNMGIFVRNCMVDAMKKVRV